MGTKCRLEKERVQDGSSESSSDEDDSGDDDDDSQESDDAVVDAVNNSALSTALAAEKEAFKITKLKDRPICVICSEATAKYQCPACRAVTCGLKCLKEHKAKYKCTGVASKAVAFVSLKEFSDKQITDDYHFLLDVEHTNTNAKRMFGKEFGGVYVDRTKSKKRKGSSKQHAATFPGSEALLHYSETARCLVRGADQRDVKLLLLPLGMSKRKQNTSFMNNHSSTMFWRVKWVWKEALVQVIFD
jgi:hypothetical protein